MQPKTVQIRCTRSAYVNRQVVPAGTVIEVSLALAASLVGARFEFVESPDPKAFIPLLAPWKDASADPPPAAPESFVVVKPLRIVA